MEWLNSLFFEHSALQAVIVMAIIIAAGLGLGKIRLWGISLGVTCVFFAGILAGHLGPILTLRDTACAPRSLANAVCRRLRCFSAGGVTVGLTICDF